MNKSGQFDLFDLFSQPETEPVKAPAPVALVAAIVPEPVSEPVVELTPQVTPEVAVAAEAAPVAEVVDAQAPAEPVDAPAPVVKATKAKKAEEPVAEAPAEELIIFTLTSASNHPLTIQELTMGDPAKRKGYLGKHRGVWLTYLVPANAFNRMSEEAKTDMRGRLQAEMEGRFA
jgi:hypothetical protein